MCHLLRTLAGFSSKEIVDVEEIAMFLHVITHDTKNCVIQREFVRSIEIVSRYFNLVLLVVLRLHDELIMKHVPNFLGMLDGTYIKVNVPATDRLTFITRKGEIATNVLDICDMKGDFVYVLSGWEGSTTDSRILWDVLARQTDCKCQRIIQTLRDFSPHTEANGTTCKSGSWVILRGKSYYPLQVQCCTILTCCLLYNLINREMTNCDDIDDVDEGNSAYTKTIAIEDIKYIETTNEWSQWYDKLAEALFIE
ncbi:hypothetical protein IC582_001038 [Cucumis melo]